jgi:hypothetical protein
LPDMIDPMVALKSFQKAYSTNDIDVRPCKLDDQLYLHVDRPQGEPRFTYARISQGRQVKGIAIFTVADPFGATRVPGRLRHRADLPEEGDGQGRGGGGHRRAEERVRPQRFGVLLGRGQVEATRCGRGVAATGSPFAAPPHRVAGLPGRRGPPERSLPQRQVLGPAECASGRAGRRAAVGEHGGAAEMGAAN